MGTPVILRIEHLSWIDSVVFYHDHTGRTIATAAPIGEPRIIRARLWDENTLQFLCRMQAPPEANAYALGDVVGGLLAPIQYYVIERDDYRRAAKAYRYEVAST